MVVQHFQNDFEFKSSNDRGEKGKEGPSPIVLAQEFPEYTEECQAISSFAKRHKATANKRRS